MRCRRSHSLSFDPILFRGGSVVVLVALWLLASFTVTAQEPPLDAPPKPTPLSKAIGKIRKLAGEGKLEEAGKVMADLVKEHPKDRNILAAAADVEQRLAFMYSDGKNDRMAANPHFLASARYYRQLEKMFKGNLPFRLKEFAAIAIYNEACSYSLDGKFDEALKSLKESIERGFTDAENTENDSDFEPLRKSEKHKAKFEELLELMKKKAEQKARPRIRT